MNKEDRVALMEMFEDTAKEADLDMEFATKDGVYSDKFTAITYHFFVSGTMLAQSVLLMSQDEA